MNRFMIVMSGLLGCCLLMAAMSSAGISPVGPTAKDEVMAESSRPDTGAVYAEIQAGFDRLEPVFRRGCFDCHSDQSRYPWYYKIPGIRQLLNSHIREGREHLDMTGGFPFEGKGSQAEMLEAIGDEIEEGEMPLWSYRLLHRNAAPSDSERDSIEVWIKHGLELLSEANDGGRTSFDSDSEIREKD